ncbi:MAG: diphosphomevalonate decarboxylase [Weeksellaceae bacterium]|jgi:diphosphomevalonate decarboxylase|nr:diphosphomevalonate decarboxylase [Weeksellaceae bacterium]MDX9704263.1 diphosphomevalonate decarboxylase [Weeksellaceae bacterium]
MYNFHSQLQQQEFHQSGKIFAQCPSNIALIKYWGKKDIQIPMNPSLSFTLNESNTQTTLQFKPKTAENFSLTIFLDNELKPDFSPKIHQFFNRIEEFLPFLKKFDFEIRTHNTFPHSSGIASSASGMGALALCLVQLENQLGGNLTEEEVLRKASFLARLGSGSACRSIYPGITVWGKSKEIKGSSDEYAIAYPYEIHEVFQNFQDTILLIDEGEKEVSSTAGHNLMNNHPYAAQRFESANENLKHLIPVLKSGDLETFGRIVEHEALSLHAMMMTSFPYYILMKPNTLSAIEKIWNFRRETRLPLFFTLDAGANVHLLYPKKDQIKIKEWIKELQIYCSNHKIIEDFTI